MTVQWLDPSPCYRAVPEPDLDYDPALVGEAHSVPPRYRRGDDSRARQLHAEILLIKLMATL